MEARTNMGKFLLGIIIGFVLVPVAGYAYLHSSHVPVAVSDPPFPQERSIAHQALDQRIDKEAPKTAPIQPDEGNLVAGAQIYHDQCAACHGLRGKPSSFGAHMYPDAPPLFEIHHHGSEAVMGVTDDPPGETYWKVANGIRLTGMPSYKNVLSDNQMWQVSVMLANADKPLPPAAIDLLNGSTTSSSSAITAAPAPAK